MSRGGKRPGAGRPKGSTDPRAAKAVIHVRVTETQHEQCKRAAEEAGLPLSEWVRRVLGEASG